jgi:hypothetical protein
MNQRSAVLLYPVPLAGIGAALVYAIGSNRRRNALLCEIRGTVEQNAARSHATYRLLKKQRRVLQVIARDSNLATIIYEETAGQLLVGTSVKVGGCFRLALPAAAYHT